MRKAVKYTDKIPDDTEFFLAIKSTVKVELTYLYEDDNRYKYNLYNTPCKTIWGHLITALLNMQPRFEKECKKEAAKAVAYISTVNDLFVKNVFEPQIAQREFLFDTLDQLFV